MWFPPMCGVRVSKNYWRPVAASLLAVKYTVFLKIFFPSFSNMTLDLSEIALFYSGQSDYLKDLSWEAKSDENEYHASVVNFKVVWIIWKVIFGKKVFFTLFWKVKFAKQFLATNPGDRNKSLVLAIKIFAAGKAGAKVWKCESWSCPD